MTALCASKSVDGRVKPGHDGAGRVARPRPVAYLLAMTAAQNARESMPSVASAHDKILIVDFGSQVTQLIARRVREEGVYSEIVPFQKAEAAFREMKPKAVILSGGPESVHEEGSPRAPQAIFDSGVPVLGICYGQMTMAAQLGGEVEGGHHREFGRADVEVKTSSRLFDDTWSMGEKHQVWMSHGDRITKMPPGFVVAGVSRERAVRGDPGREAQILRVDVPPRSGAHARRRKTPAQFRPQGRRPDRRLDHARLPRGGDREDPRAGRQGQGDLRPLRRRRFSGRRGADPRGDRRPAHLRVRRSRHAAARRGQDGRRPVPASLQHPAGTR